MGKSKHNKSSWREVNIKDVDDFLEDQRLQERLGINFATKPDRELFVVDTQPLSNEELKSKLTTGRLTRVQRRKLVLSEAPKCFQSLVNTSKVTDPVKKRNSVKPVTLSRHTVEKNKRKGTSAKKLESALENRKQHRARKEKQKRCRTEFTEDLWTEEKVEKEKMLPKEWLSQDTIVCNTIIKPKKPQGISPDAPCINTPHPGISYNPTYKEHQELLVNVVQNELKVIKEEEHLDRVTSEMFRKVKMEELMKEHEKQLREGLEDSDGHHEISDGEDYKSINPPVVNKKRDLKKKRHIREQKAIKVKAIVEAKEKKKLSEIYKLKYLQKSIVEKEKMDNFLNLKRTMKKMTETKIPHISTKPFEEPPPDFVPAENLSGNLRNINPQGGGLFDHFTSLQRRGMATVSTPLTLKKGAIKRYKLASHRMPWEQIERPVKIKKEKQPSVM